MRHILEEATGELIAFTLDAENRLTFREGLLPYVGEMPFLEFGMMLVLGPSADTVLTDCALPFLPACLMEVMGETQPINIRTREEHHTATMRLARFFLLALVATVVATLVRRTPRWIGLFTDIALFGLAGLLGSLLATTLFLIAQPLLSQEIRAAAIPILLALVVRRTVRSNLWSRSPSPGAVF